LLDLDRGLLSYQLSCSQNLTDFAKVLHYL